MPGIRIAAVIPAYNAAGTIEKAIVSAQAQQRPPEEIIVVDDGSTDETAAVAAATGVRVIRQANAGPAAARNLAIASTSAEWIALLDADDRWHPEKLARQLAHLDDPRLAVVYTGANVEGRLNPLPPPSYDFESLWARNRITLSSALLRRAAWESVGGFDTTREIFGVDDYNLWLRLAHAGWHLIGVQERLMYYEPTDASMTMQTRTFALAELAQLAHVAATLELDPAKVRAKEFEKYLEYGIELFYFRDLPTAREFLREAARRGPIPLSARLRLLATYLPFAAKPSR